MACQNFVAFFRHLEPALGLKFKHFVVFFVSPFRLKILDVLRLEVDVFVELFDVGFKTFDGLLSSRASQS